MTRHRTISNDEIEQLVAHNDNELAQTQPPSPVKKDGIVHKGVSIIRFTIVILFFGPLILLSCVYGNASKQYRVLKAFSDERTYILDLNVATPTTPFKLQNLNGRAKEAEFIDQNIPYKANESASYVTIADEENVDDSGIRYVDAMGQTHTDEELAATPDPTMRLVDKNNRDIKFMSGEQVWQHRGLSKMAPAPGGDNFFWCYQSFGDGGYEYQYFQAKAVRNYRAYVELATTISEMRATFKRLNPKFTFPENTFPTIRVVLTTLGDLRTEKPQSRINPFSDSKYEFPQAGLCVNAASEATLIASMRFSNDRRSGDSTYSPIRDCFLYSLPAASDAQSDVHAYASRLMNDETFWVQLGHKVLPNANEAFLKETVSKVLSDVREKYSHDVERAPEASKFFRRENRNFWNTEYVKEQQ